MLMKFSNFRFLKENPFSGSAVRPVGVWTDGRTDKLVKVLIDLLQESESTKRVPLGLLNPQMY
jgi:hypothetical protein